VYKHYVLVCTQKGTLVILSDESGQVLFEHPGAAEIVGGLAVFRNLALVPYKNGRVAAFDCGHENRGVGLQRRRCR